MDRDKGINGHEQVDNGRRSSTLDLFQFGADRGAGRPTGKQSYQANFWGYLDDLALKSYKHIFMFYKSVHRAGNKGSLMQIRGILG